MPAEANSHTTHQLQRQVPQAALRARRDRETHDGVAAEIGIV